MSRRIEEIMNRELLAVLPDTPAKAVRELLRAFAIDSAPVVDERRRPLGMITARALLEGADGSAADRMSSPASCVEGSADIAATARRLALEHASHAPDAAGVLVLVQGRVSETDVVVWVEASSNVRERVRRLAALASSGEPALARLLERHDLRFRAAAVPLAADRERITSRMRDDLEHRPPPGAT